MLATNGKLIILTAPSGAGKTSIKQYLIQHFPNLAFSISAATRNRRENEKEGVDYYFMSVAAFQEKINQHAFVEWEMVYEGNYYGTLKEELERIWAIGKVPMLDIDVQGAIHVQKEMGNNCLSIFIEPPSVEELANRLKTRGSETAETLSARINKASYEMSFSDQFSKKVLNKDLSTACKETENLVKAFLGW